jgi:hypothetical protein
LDLFSRSLLPSDKGFLNHVFGIRNAAEHSIGDGEQKRSVLIKCGKSRSQEIREESCSPRDLTIALDGSIGGAHECFRISPSQICVLICLRDSTNSPFQSKAFIL